MIEIIISKKTRKGVVTRKEDNKLYIRYYGSSIYDGGGTAGKVGETLFFDDDTDINIGDFVSTQEIEPNSPRYYGYYCKKIEPSKEDIESNDNLQKYLNEIAQHGGDFFKDIIFASQAKFKKEKNSNPMHIILDEKEISTLIEKYKTSIQTMGVYGGSGSAAFGLQCQLGINNLFDKDRIAYQNIIGVDTAPPRMKMVLPSCLSKDYLSDDIQWIGDVGNPSGLHGNGSNYIISFSKQNLLRISISEQGVSVPQPYIPGSVIDLVEWEKYSENLDRFISFDSSKPTNMVTAEEFNSTYQDSTQSNCLGFAIGRNQTLSLGEKSRGAITDFFQEQTRKFGLVVKPVNSLEDLKGKTGFIVYGYYEVRGFSGIEIKDFHVVRVNPDGTLVHKPDDRNLASSVELLSKKGGIENFNRDNEPIYIFELIEERNMDTQALQRKFELIYKKLLSKNLTQSIFGKLQEVASMLNISSKLTNSNSINLLLDEIEREAMDLSHKDTNNSVSKNHELDR